MTNLSQIYRPRRTPLHLLPAWVKVLGVAAGALAIVGRHDWKVSAVVAAACLVALLSTLPPPGPVARTTAAFLAFAAIGAGFHGLRGEWAIGASVGLNVVAVVFLSLALVASTSTESLLAFFSGLARPFRRWIPNEAVGLAASLMVRSLPEASRILGETRDSARARGLGRSPRAVLVPAGVRIVAYALAVGDAITARGLADEGPYTSSERATRRPPARYRGPDTNRREP